jgi:hypothetical protein
MLKINSTKIHKFHAVGDEMKKRDFTGIRKIVQSHFLLSVAQQSNWGLPPLCCGF